MSAQKRNLQQTSPDISSDNIPKKHTAINMMVPISVDPANPAVSSNVSVAGRSDIATSLLAPPSAADCFSWAVFDQKLNNALDAKLESVVKKDDLAYISTEIQQLRSDNTRLQNELQIMKNRLEQVDKASRRNNIVVSGLVSKTVPKALDEFNKLCKTTLKANVNVTEAHKIAGGKSFLLTLNSAMEVNAIIAGRRFLNGTHIFIDKDYTADVRNKRYYLRQIGNNAKNINKDLKVRYGDLRIFIDDKPFYYADEKIIANNNADADFLRDLMSKANFVCNIEAKKPQNINSVPTAATSNVVPATAAAVPIAAATSFKKPYKKNTF